MLLITSTRADIFPTKKNLAKLRNRFWKNSIFLIYDHILEGFINTYRVIL